LGPLERANLNHWTTSVKNNKSNINTWDQALAMGDKRKKNNNNYDKAYRELKLI
jgi:hypothetical protein